MTRPRSGGRWLPVLCILGILLFSALGTWQVQRLAWKRDLIARVDARIAAAPVPAPLSDAWPDFDPLEAQYRKVQVIGTYLHGSATRVDALTTLGAGDWLVTPLRTANGIVLVNRGFVPREGAANAAALPADGQVAPTPAPQGGVAHPELSGEVRVTGLMRASEPGGRILRSNQPAAERWFSRDVEAIARARGLGAVAPYFIDADATTSLAGGPVGGLTVVRFRNPHLTYAITWFALAALCLGGLVIVIRGRQATAPRAAGDR